MGSIRPELSAAVWHKSSYSNGDGGECVEVARNLPGIVPVRDSTVPHGPVLVVSADAWVPFVDGVRHGTC
ncbi:DUF397 domain-containing protein [Streptomyces sp. NPDC096176]|uniref:DUF397 domain-containing protein n=1 Tax=Streptomyces sp. NPDC096176 TaxID=3366079 RepID=UPI0038128F2C